MELNVKEIGIIKYEYGGLAILNAGPSYVSRIVCIGNQLIDEKKIHVIS